MLRLTKEELCTILIIFTIISLYLEIYEAEVLLFCDYFTIIEYILF